MKSRLRSLDIMVNGGRGIIYQISFAIIVPYLPNLSMKTYIGLQSIYTATSVISDSEILSISVTVCHGSM